LCQLSGKRTRRSSSFTKSTDYSEQNYGKATRGACLALKSRILLYAASPLFNGGAETQNADLAKIVSNPTYDVAHWQKAADAAWQ
jgi:hypothetical protein